MENKKEDHTEEIKGVKIGSFNTGMIFLTCVLYLFLLWATVYIYDKSAELVDSTQEYIELEKSANLMAEASDYLTEQCRLYVRTLNVEYAKLYFRESNETRRREEALALLETYHINAEYQDCLEESNRQSRLLMEREIYAMKLVAQANGHGLEHGLPPEVHGKELRPADAALEPAVMLEKGRNMVYDTVYQDSKRIIEEHVKHFTDGILEDTESRLFAGAEALMEATVVKRIFLSVLFLMNVLTFGLILWLVVRPLKHFSQNVKDQTTLDDIGSYEFRYLAKVYNDIYEENRRNAAKEALLMHKIEHDPLTGLMNRHVFSQIDMVLGDTTAPLALLAIDVDWFKEINDTHGHETGDKVLQKVAALLEKNFRANDYVFRIGGDEFVGIMTDVTQDRSHVIREKIARINDELQTPQDGLPATSLSVGAAFSEAGYDQDLFGQADRALYWVKGRGRCGCGIYGQDIPPV